MPEKEKIRLDKYLWSIRLFKTRTEAVVESDLKRKSSYSSRRLAQRDHLQLPDLPTTTIGSFPQVVYIIANVGRMIFISSVPAVRFNS